MGYEQIASYGGYYQNLLVILLDWRKRAVYFLLFIAIV